MTPPTNRAWRLIRDSALYGFAGAIGKVLALITVPILSRSLGPADYGLADLATALSSVIVLLVTFSGDIPAARLAGLSNTAPRRREVHASWLAATVGASSAAALLLLPMAPVIAAELWSAPSSAGLAVLAIILVPITAAQTTLVSILRIESRPVASASMATLDLVAQLTLGVGLVILGFGPTGLLLGLVAGGTIGLIGAAMAAGPHLQHAPSRATVIRLVRMGIPFIPGAVLFVGADYAVRYWALERLGAEAIGQFAIANRIAATMLLISAAFSLAWGPFGLAQQLSERTRRLFGLVVEAFGAFGAVTALAISALGPEITVLIGGSAYLPASQALPGLLLAAVMSGLFYIFGIAAGVQERTRALPIAALLGTVLQVAMTVVLIPHLGLVAIGIATASGRALAVILLAAATRRAIALRPMTIPLAVAVLVVVIGLGFANQQAGETLPLRLIVAAGTAVTCVALWPSIIRPVLREFNRH